MDIQACLPPALTAIHNFICKDDPHELDDYEDIEDPQPGLCAAGGVGEGQLLAGLSKAAERKQADARSNRIAKDMWEQYIAEHSQHNQGK